MTEMNEDRIIAYVDGELGPIEALRFERAMEADAALAAAVARHRSLRAAVAGHYAPVAQEAVPARLSALLDRNPTVVSFPERRGRWSGPAGRYAALAATLVVGLMVGQLLPRSPASPIEHRDGAVVAGGDLGRALDSQLASATPDGAAYRIGVSFRAADGRYCRTFDGTAGAGIGCHGVAGWGLERFIAGAPAASHGTYRQAASGDADILAAAQEMMAGEPLDAAGEKQAQASGWARAPQR